MLSVDIVNKIIKEFGSPCYVFDQMEFTDNYHHLLSTMRSFYSKYNIAYSYKTNYTPYVCKCVKELGGMAEVVSDMEYDLAKKLGYENSNIIYNGPYKGEALEEHAIKHGIINIDCFDEAVRIVSIAEKNKKVDFRVGIRLNLNIGAGFVSRFGIEVNSTSLEKTIKLLISRPNIHLAGFHIHISRARSLEFWKKRVDQLLQAVDKYFIGAPDYIDVGSGMYGSMESSLEVQFGPNVPNYDEYARVVAGTVKEHYEKSRKKPLLISEPGTTIVSKYWYLITRVIQDKKIAGVQFSTVDSSFQNVGEICTIKKLPFYVLRNGQILDEKSSRKIDVLGYTCLEQDRLYSDCRVAIKKDDILVFGNVGGYSIVNKPPFIHPNFKALCLDSNRNVLIIKRDETFDDIFRSFVI